VEGLAPGPGAIGHMSNGNARNGTRRVLMIAYQFPPFGQSTGGIRVLSFARDLPALGWQPAILTAREHAYTDRASTAGMPAGLKVFRAWGHDIARLASIRGMFPRFLATPDRWNTWALGCIPEGLRAIRETRPQVLWCTFPIPSALVAGLVLARLSRIPLVVDLRDPVVYESWPVNAWDRFFYRQLERCMTRIAAAVVTTTPGARAMYQQRYPAIAARFHVVPNGIEQGDATGSRPAPESTQAAAGRIVLLHSGLMEIPDRDPTALFRALRVLRDSGNPQVGRLLVILRGSNNDSRFSTLVREHGVEDLVQVLPRVERSEALREASGATASLIFQGRHCNRQIPAKAYECLAAGKPIVALVDPEGDTHRLIADEWQVPYCADMEDPTRIAAMLSKFLQDLATGKVHCPPASLHTGYGRAAQAGKLAGILDVLEKGTDSETGRTSQDSAR
jgi:glycosyltransferase involved in cell wall biosynthesis